MFILLLGEMKRKHFICQNHSPNLECLMLLLLSFQPLEDDVVYNHGSKPGKKFSALEKVMNNEFDT